MKSTTEILDALRAQAGSDGKAAAQIGVSQVSFSRWRAGRDFPSDDNVLRIAELLKLDPAYALAVVNGARAKSHETKQHWQRIARAFNKAAAVIAFVVAPFMSPQDSRAAFDTNAFCAALPCDGQRPSHSGSEYTLRSNRRRWWQRLAAWLGVAS